MKGIVFLGDKKLEIQDFPDPIPGPDDVILEIQAWNETEVPNSFSKFHFVMF